MPYISKVTGVPMVDLATRVMVGQPLASLGYGTGLYRQPPYVAVKVPVFSFEKITDANAALSPEMKSTGEVLGLGKNMQEALFKGLVSAGYKVEKATRGGVLISVNHRDQPEIVNIARKLDEMGYKLYATDGTASEISRLGTDVEIVGKLGKDNRVFQMLENGRIDYVILTGSTEPSYIKDFIHLNHRCVQLGIPCLTSLDTANALTDILASRYNQHNTELIDICHLRTERQKLKFAKMQTCGNDYIFWRTSMARSPAGVPVRHLLRPALRHWRRRHYPHGALRHCGCENADVQRRRQRGCHGGQRAAVHGQVPL